MLPATRLSPCRQALPWHPVGVTRIETKSGLGPAGGSELLAGAEIAHATQHRPSCSSSYHGAATPARRSLDTKEPRLLPEGPSQSHSPHVPLGTPQHPPESLPSLTDPLTEPAAPGPAPDPTQDTPPSSSTFSPGLPLAPRGPSSPSMPRGPLSPWVAIRSQDQGPEGQGSRSSDPRPSTEEHPHTQARPTHRVPLGAPWPRRPYGSS